MKTVQIPYELFVDLVLYHLNGEDDFDEDIRQGLEQKLDAMLNRQLYSQYKTSIEKSADLKMDSRENLQNSICRWVV